MLSILSAIIGFLAPFVPQLLKLWEAKGDRKHELDMMEMRLKYAAQEHLWRMEEIQARADIEDMRMVRQPQQSMGVQLLDAGKDWLGKGWMIIPFYLFVILDLVAGLVRPLVTYAAFVGYLTFKWATFGLAREIGGNVKEAIISVWTEQDWAVLTLVLSYWFGARVAAKVFGTVPTSR